jgi:hypothetical protein
MSKLSLPYLFGVYYYSHFLQTEEVSRTAQPHLQSNDSPFCICPCADVIMSARLLVDAIMV